MAEVEHIENPAASASAQPFRGWCRATHQLMPTATDRKLCTAMSPTALHDSLHCSASNSVLLSVALRCSALLRI